MNNKLRIVFMVTPEFSIPSLKKISEVHNVISVYTQPPKSSGRGMKIHLSPVHFFSNSKTLSPITKPATSAFIDDSYPGFAVINSGFIFQ